MPQTLSQNLNFLKKLKALQETIPPYQNMGEEHSAQYWQNKRASASASATAPVARSKWAVPKANYLPGPRGPHTRKNRKSTRKSRKNRKNRMYRK